MIEQRDLLVMAGGAAGAAQSYLSECRQFRPETDKATPLDDERMPAMLLALQFTTIQLLAALKVNCKNRGAWGELDATITDASRKIANATLDKLANGPDNSQHSS